MSRYLNPKDKPKEVWLFDNGFMIPNPWDIIRGSKNPISLEKAANSIINTLVNCEIMRIGVGPWDVLSQKEKDKLFFDDHVIVDMVNNGKFRAAAVYASRDEMLMVYNDREGMLVDDERQRLWFIVDREKALAEVRPF